MPKTNVGLELVAIIGIFCACNAIAACETIDDCIQTAPSGDCCMATGDTKMVKYCPYGWTMNAAQTLCTRTGSTSGSDSTGVFTTTYGSCSPEENVEDCYELVPWKNCGPADDCLCVDE